MHDVISTADKKTVLAKKGDLLTLQQADQITKDGVAEVLVRSPLSCKSFRGVCQKCYGWDMGRNALVKLGESVGVVAAQAIGARGGVVSGGGQCAGADGVQFELVCRQGCSATGCGGTSERWRIAGDDTAIGPTAKSQCAVAAFDPDPEQHGCRDCCATGGTGGRTHGGVGHGTVCTGRSGRGRFESR